MKNEKQIKIGSMVRSRAARSNTSRYGVVIEYLKNPRPRRGRPNSKLRTLEFIEKGMLARGEDCIRVHWSNGEEGFSYPHLVEVVAAP